jgi:hypothetical protein
VRFAGRSVVAIVGLTKEMAMSELDELERDLEEAANIWFSPALHRKIRRVIAIAREGEKAVLSDASPAIVERRQLRFDAEHDLGV